LALTRKSTRPALAIVNGFLGAGKTTLLLKAAEILRAAGMRVALITNDQGAELVDTHLARAAGFETGEVAGGCFCCRYSDFLRSAESLLAAKPDVIFAEPVGSCMDLAATLFQRLPDCFALAPLTVVVDPGRARETLDPEVEYLFRNQLAEADVVCYTRADLYPDTPPRRVSGITGEGVAEWLEEILWTTGPVGERVLDLDYARYARAEAALGWLNWRIELRLERALTPAGVVGRLIEGFADIAVAHLKVFDNAAGGYLKASVCRASEEPLIDGRLDLPPVRRHAVVINLRALAAPELLEETATRALGIFRGRVRFLHREAFRPAAPVRLDLNGG
jgi:hypothetical protein